MPAQLKRVDAEGRLPTTEFAFRILFIPDGYADPASRLQAAREAWEKVLNTSPFNLCKEPGQPASRAFAAYAWTDGLPTLNLQVIENKLSIPLNKANAISEALANTTVADADPHGGQPATTIWPKGGRFGRRGVVLVILSNRTQPAELYELSPSENYPSPVVGVVPVGALWPNVIVRAIAQAYAGLIDEFERPEPEFLKAQADALTLQPTNVIFVSQQRRDEFVAGNTNALRGISRWPLNSQAPIGVFPHQGDDADTTKKRPRNSIALIEGGGGFRFNAFRSDLDCLMRRTPHSTSLPIQDTVSFCRVCTHFLSAMLRGAPEFNGLTPSVEIDRQRLQFDRLDWNTVDPPLISTPSKPVQLSVKNVGIQTVKPAWIFDVSVDLTIGMKIENLRLKDRDVDFDPFFRAENVVKSVTFANLSVSYILDGTPINQPLSFVDAFKEPTGVALRIKRNGSDLVQAGAKATFSWTIPGVMIVEAETSLVVRGAKPDFDPGGAVRVCKYWPQLSLRYRRVARLRKKLRVDALSGTINIEMNNVIPENLQLPPDAPEHIEHLRNGRLVTGLFTDSNSSDTDSDYKDPGFFPAVFEWVSGRKLAAVTTPIPAEARRQHIYNHVPVLPHWSWLFDYVTPTIGARRTIVGAYHRPYQGLNDQTKDGQFNGGLPRRKSFKWPSDADQTTTPPREYRLRVDRTARQGQYDNIHAAADHGQIDKDNPDKNATVTSAPFCADVCNHLHWRWGSIAASGATELYAFFGWGVGKVGQGSNRVMGAPLIPPNQHLDIILSPQGADRCLVGYAVKAVRPGEKEWQVCLEQGIGFAFSYAGLIKRSDLRKLAAAFGQFIGIPEEEASQKRDYEQRALFDNIYHQVKFFDADHDDTVPFVLQTPSRIGSDGFLTVPPEVEDF